MNNQSTELPKHKNGYIYSSDLNLSEDLWCLVRTHFDAGEIVTVQDLFECFDEYVFWFDNEDPYEKLFGKLGKKTKILIDIE